MHIDIDPELDVKVAGKYGNENVRKIFALGMILNNSKESGFNLLNRTISNNSSLNIDRYIAYDSTSEIEFLSYFAEGKSFSGNLNILDFYKILDFENKFYTNMRFNEFYELFRYSLGIGNNERTSASIENFKEHLHELTFDSNIAAEQSSVSVLNGSGIPFQASKASEVIKAVGGRVLAVENSSLSYPDSILVVRSKDLEIVSYLSSFFEIPAERILTAEEFEGFENAILRSDVTLILGVDTVNYL